MSASVKKEADAEKYKQQQMADVDLYKRQKDAEAKKFETEREAETLRINADALKYQAEQEAEAIRAKGLAEAEAIKAKGVAEAEATEKKAEAMSKMKEAAILEMFFNVLPDVASSVAEPLKNIDKITMFGEGNTSKLVEDITKSTTQIIDGLSSGFNIDMKSVLAGALGGKLLASGNKNDSYSYEQMKDLVKTALSETSESQKTEVKSEETSTETLTETPVVAEVKAPNVKENRKKKG